MSEVQQATDVLATMRPDGSRRILRPREAPGRYLLRRRIIGYALIAIFVALPFVHIGGRPGMFINLPGRELNVLGGVFHATDTVLLMLFVLGSFVTVFLTTAVFGRAWCGYACPQTVYLELIFRPLERLIEGRGYARNAATPARSAVKLLVFAVLAVFLSNVFVAYFISGDVLLQSIPLSPTANPVAFVVMAFTSVLVLVDFAWFREQMCSITCPYARIQSALLDPQSAIIAYDVDRGEPRALPRERKSGAAFGDCIDCAACVVACPAGIDIRRGLQLECVACAQCADACDAVMQKRGRPLGLVGYKMPRLRAALMRPRVWLYSGIIVGAITAFTILAGHDRTLEVDVLASPGAPFLVLDNDEIGTPARLRLANHSQAERDIEVRVDAGTLVIPENPVHLKAGESRTLSAMVRSPRAGLTAGRARRELSFVDKGVVQRVEPLAVTGPVGGAP